MKSQHKNDKPIRSYLTFRLGEEQYGIHVSQVLNILEMTRITDVPQAPDYMKGVINLRGMVLPVIDTRLKFGMPEVRHTSETCIVVMDLDVDDDTMHLGAIVDSVLSVTEISEDEIQPPPSIGNQYQSKFIFGMAKKDDRFVMLLDMQHLFGDGEMSNYLPSQNQVDQVS